MVEKQVTGKPPFRLEKMTVNRYGLGVRHIQCICMCLCMIALFIARSSMSVAIIAMTDVSRRKNSNVEIYNWDKQTQSYVQSSFFYGYMAMQIPAGILAKKYGGKLILLVALIANGTLSGVFPTMASLGGWPAACIVRLVMGLTQACLFPASHTLLGRWLPSTEQTSLSGLIYGGYLMGTIIALPVSGVLAETAIGWKLIFYSITGLEFVTALIWYCLAASTPEEHFLIGKQELEYIQIELNSTPASANRPIPWKALLKTRPLWAIMASHIGSSIIFILFFVDIPTYMEKALQISLKNSAILSALPYAGMWIGSILSTNVCESILNRRLLTAATCRKIFNSIALFGSAIGLVGLSFIGRGNNTLAVSTLVCVLFLYGFNSAGFMMNHLDLSSHFAGVMFSITNFAGTLSISGVPSCISLILNNDSTDIGRWRIVFLIIAVVATVCNIVYIIFGSSDRQEWDDPNYKDRVKAKPDELKPALSEKHQEKDSQRKH